MGKYVLFGAGQRGRDALKIIGKEDVAYFCDNFKEGSIDGIDIINYNALEDLYSPDKYTVVVTSNDVIKCIEIAKQLDQSNISFLFLDDSIFFQQIYNIPIEDYKKIINSRGVLLSYKTYVKGNYLSNQEAYDFLPDKYKKGYAQENILNQVYAATQKVRHGEGAFERDGILFKKKDYNANVMMSLMYALNEYDGIDTVDVLDYGGSLGSIYFQHRGLLDTYKYTWNIIEQENYVKIGKAKIPEIDFYFTLSEYKEDGKKCDILLLGSVLQYFSNPASMLTELLSCGFDYIIIDRTLFNFTSTTRYGIQYVSPLIYDAAYPISLLSEQELLSIIDENKYELVYSWNMDSSIYAELDRKGYYKVLPIKGFFIKRKGI